MSNRNTWKIDQIDFSQIHRCYQKELLEHSIPFWEKYAIDWENGGINTCIKDNGQIICEDKLLWSQGRAVYTFASLYNTVSPKEKWLKIATNIFQLIDKFGRDENGQWVFRISNQGEILEGPTSIFVDGFIIIGLIELYKANPDDKSKSLLQDMLQNVLGCISRPGSYRTEPYSHPPGIMSHAVFMLFSLVCFEAGIVLGDEALLNKAKEFADKILDDFLDQNTLCINEFVLLDGGLWDNIQGRAQCPGHAIECMWFLILIYRHFHEKEKIELACKVIHANLIKGWDSEYGGLLLWVDRESKEPWNHFHDTKAWWPHCESLVACLMAYQEIQESWCLEWFQKIHNYSFEKFRLPDGEWTQRLNKDGSLKEEYIALPVKDPFHLPRALMVCSQISKELSGKTV